MYKLWYLFCMTIAVIALIWSSLVFGLAVYIFLT